MLATHSAGLFDHAIGRSIVVVTRNLGQVSPKHVMRLIIAWDWQVIINLNQEADIDMLMSWVMSDWRDGVNIDIED